MMKNKVERRKSRETKRQSGANKNIRQDVQAAHQKLNAAFAAKVDEIRAAIFLGEDVATLEREYGVTIMRGRRADGNVQVRVFDKLNSVGFVTEDRVRQSRRVSV